MGDKIVIKKYPLINIMQGENVYRWDHVGQIYGTQFGTIDIKIWSKIKGH